MTPDKTTTIQEVKTDQELKWLRADKLKVDHSYQRALNKIRVKKIVEEFDPESFGTIEVSRRDDGTHVIIDGQHRIAALLDMSWGDQLVPCHIRLGLTVADEARIFGTANGKAARPSKISMFKAALVSGDIEAQAIFAVVEANGLVVSGAPGDGHIQAVSALEKVSRSTSYAHLGKTLGTMAKAWGRDSSSFQHDLLVGTALFTWRYCDMLDHDRTVKVLSTLMPFQILASARTLKTAAAHSSSGATWTMGVPQVMVNAYNKGIRKGTVPAWESRHACSMWDR